MYNLKEGWLKVFGTHPIDDWDGKLICTITDATTTLRTNQTQGFLAAYSFTIVVEGWLNMVYNGEEFLLEPDDLYIYSPGLPLNIISASHNYRAICLIADEHITLETHAAHDLVHIAFLPIVQLHQPKQRLAHDAALRLTGRMHEIIDYLNSSHIYKQEIVRALYAVFLLDLQGIQHNAIGKKRIPQRVEEIFMAFIRMLPHHFAEHHDIAFYASQLHISNVYLSRVVRLVTGRTVVDYINQMLLMEASFLLTTSQLSIAQIADRLHFADSATLSKFFVRHKGLSPRKYREGVTEKR